VFSYYNIDLLQYILTYNNIQLLQHILTYYNIHLLQYTFTIGGLNLNATKYARIAEVTGRDGALSVTLAAHQSIGLKVLWGVALSSVNSSH